MDLDNILDVMSSYNFRKPLKTVIIMEDNEDTDVEEETGVENIDQWNIGNGNVNTTEKDPVSISPETVPSNEHISQCLNAQTDKKSSTNSIPESGESKLIQKTSKQILTKRRRLSNKEPNVNDGSPSQKKRTSYEKLIDESCNRKCSHADTDQNKQNYYDRKSEFYIKSTLRIVSENLLHVIASKEQVKTGYYNKNSSMYGRPDLVEKQILALKYSFFKMTYSVTVTILLPLENNKIFIKTLLLSSLEFGNSSGVYTSFEELEKIYLDMLLWTKEYRYRCVPPLSAYKGYSAYSATMNLPTNSETSTTNCPPSPLQSNMPPKKLSTPQKHQVTHQPPGYYVAANHQQRYGTSTSPSDKNLVLNYQNKNALSVLSSNSSPISSLPRTNNKQKRQNIFPHELKTSNDINQSLLQINYQANTIFSKSIIPSEVDAQKSFQGYMPPLTYSNIDLKYSFQGTGDIRAHNVTSSNNEPTQASRMQYETRSSLSRDSGCMSPVESTNEMEGTRYITEVTSLNPNVKQVNLGPCVVCQKSTRKVCLGCYKEYYCSYECMLANWPNHRVRCTAPENHSFN